MWWFVRPALRIRIVGGPWVVVISRVAVVMVVGEARSRAW